jgi:hypothetical protein
MNVLFTAVVGSASAAALLERPEGFSISGIDNLQNRSASDWLAITFRSAKASASFGAKLLLRPHGVAIDVGCINTIKSTERCSGRSKRQKCQRPLTRCVIL